MTDKEVSRVRYYDQQILRTSDFVDEQAYHLAQRRRHNIGGHIWGIVSGLELAQDSNGALGVQPGMAIDGYGRELILAEYQPISPSVFDDKGGETLDVYLEYAQQTSNEAPPGYTACRTNGQSADTRVQETARVVIRKASGPPRLEANEAGIDLPERRQLEEVPRDDLRFSPARVPPDDPQRRWPVFLGQLRRGLEPPVDLSGRPYAGLRGEMVHAPSGWAWLQVGEWEDNDYRFGVFLAEAEDDKEANGIVPESPPRGPHEPILGITVPKTKMQADAQPENAELQTETEPQGPEVELRADTRLYGDLIVEGGAVEFGDGPAYRSAHPWRIYHARTKAALDAIEEHQLRIEMAGSGESNIVNEVVVGHWSDQKQAFVPCLTVAADCDVTVHRNLVVNGDFNKFDKADVSNENLISYVVGRTEKDQIPPWFDTLIAELEKHGLLDELVDELTKSDYRATFLEAIVQRVKSDRALRDALANKLAARGIAEIFLGLLVGDILEQRKDDPQQRAKEFADMLLRDLVQEMRRDDELLKVFTEVLEEQDLELIDKRVPPPAPPSPPTPDTPPLAPPAGVPQAPAAAEGQESEPQGSAAGETPAAKQETAAKQSVPKEAAPSAATETSPQAPDAAAETQMAEVTDTDLRRLARQLHDDRDLRKRFADATQRLQQSMKDQWNVTPPAQPEALAVEDEMAEVSNADLQRIVDQLDQDPELQKRFAELTTTTVRRSLRALWPKHPPSDAPAPSGNGGI